MINKPDLIQLVREMTPPFGLDPKLMCALIEQESSWNQYAIRFEPAFYSRYVEPQNLASQTEAYARSFSWGLCQIMGQVAREFGFKGQFLSELCDPAVNIQIGMHVLKAKLGTHPASVEAGLLAYNGGGNPSYGQEVLNRISKYA